MRQLRSKFNFFFIVLITCSALFCSSASRAGLFGSDENNPLPGFRIPTLFNTSKQLSNQTMRGRVSLINVWASWCRYCRKEHSILMEINRNYQIPIYGIVFRDNPESARNYLRSYGNPYTLVGVDWSGEVSASLGADGTPQTYIIDKQGAIRYRYAGAIDKWSWEHTFLPLIQKYQREK